MLKISKRRAYKIFPLIEGLSGKQAHAPVHKFSSLKDP